MAAKRYVPHKERASGFKAAQRASAAVQLPLPIRKGFPLHVSVLPFMLPGEYIPTARRNGRSVGEEARNPRNDYPELTKRH
jgi:hypothetical protein